MKSLTSIIFIIVIIFIIFIKPPGVEAVSCSGVLISGNYTVSSSCEFSGTVDGVDAGTGTSNTANIIVNSGQTLTISAGQTVVFGGSITVNGSISIVNTGQIRQTALWMTDADSDNYPASLTQTAQSTQPASGRRRNLMTSITSADCGDSSANIFQNVASTGTDADQDGYYIGTLATNCVGGTTTVSARTYYLATGGSYTWIVGSPTGGANAIAGSDCSDSSAVVQVNRTQYTDGDADNYTVVGGTVCMSNDTWATSACNTAGTSYAKNSASSCLIISALSGVDCSDTNSNIFQNVASLVTDAENDGYTIGSAATQCVGTTSVINTRTYYKNASAGFTWLASASGLGSDCNESVAGTCPNVVSILVSELIGEDNFRSVWTEGSVPAGSGAVTGYDVYRCLGNGCTPTTLVSDNQACLGPRGSTCAFTNSGLVCNTVYGNKVLAKNSAGNSADSATQATLTAACP